MSHWVDDDGVVMAAPPEVEVRPMTCLESVVGSVSSGMTRRSEIVAAAARDAWVAPGTVSAELSSLVAGGVLVRTGRGVYALAPALQELLED